MALLSSNKKVLVAIVLVIAFIYAAFTVASILSAAAEQSVCAAEMLCPHEAQLNFLISVLPLITSIAVVVGAVVYSMMSGRVESTQHSLKRNTEVLLRFLSQDERKLMNALIDGKGKVLQAEITRLPGMSKVKSHRVVQKLIDKGVIEKDRIGKTNIVRFTKEIKEGLL